MTVIRSLDEALFRAEQLKLDATYLETLLKDLEAQRDDPTANPPPRPRPPSVERPQPGQPAPTQYGAMMDRAATKGQKDALRARARGFGITEVQIDAIVQRKFRKDRWNMITQGECVTLMKAIESGER